MDVLRARKSDEKENRRQAILTAAKGLFASQGMTSTTIDQIAFACKLSRSLVYTYFLDKNHLLYVLVSEALSLMLKAFDLAKIDKTKGLDSIMAIGWAYVDFALSNPEYYEVISLFQFSSAIVPTQNQKGEIPLLERFESDLKDVFYKADQINQVMATEIKRGMDDYSIKKDLGEPLEVALSLWAITGGLIQTTSANKATFSQAYGISQDKIISQGLKLAYDGLKNKEVNL